MILAFSLFSSAFSSASTYSLRGLEGLASGLVLLYLSVNPASPGTILPVG
jgi:hypothetical protein